MRAILAWIANARDWLTLIAVAAAAAYFYAEFATVKRDRDDLRQWAEVVCASSGSEFAGTVERQPQANGTRVTIAFRPGQRCRQTVAALAGFKAKSDQETARLLTDAMRDQTTRNDTDTRAARTAAEAARSAAERMEAADAEAERKNLVDREWFAAVNGVAGLRPAPR